VVEVELVVYLQLILNLVLAAQAAAAMALLQLAFLEPLIQVVVEAVVTFRQTQVARVVQA
jgi:hypothetical protein